MQILPPSLWLVFLLLMQFGAQKCTIVMKSPNSVAFVSEFLSWCCLSPVLTRLLWRVWPSLRVNVSQRGFVSLPPGSITPQWLPLSTYLYLFCFSLEETEAWMPTVIGKWWLWFELRQCGPRICALSHCLGPPRPHVMVTVRGTCRLGRVPGGPHCVCYSAASFVTSGKSLYSWGLVCCLKCRWIVHSKLSSWEHSRRLTCLFFMCT